MPDRTNGSGEHGAGPEDRVGETRAIDAADRAVRAERLLDGENPETRHADDVDHWISAYSELIAYKETLIAKTQEEAGTMVNPAALMETEKVDLTILRRELENYRRRLTFWLGRRAELNA
jgi:hypothetical protein